MGTGVSMYCTDRWCLAQSSCLWLVGLARSPVLADYGCGNLTDLIPANEILHIKCRRGSAIPSEIF